MIEIRYEIVNDVNHPPSCLPLNLDRTYLKDITCIGDSWRKYLDTRTGQMHDGAVYYRQALQAMAADQEKQT